jgi:hypothetical protein
MASAMDVDDEEIELPTSSSGKGEKKRFEVKKVIMNVSNDYLSIFEFFVLVLKVGTNFVSLSWLQ